MGLCRGSPVSRGAPTPGLLSPADRLRPESRPEPGGQEYVRWQRRRRVLSTGGGAGELLRSEPSRYAERSRGTASGVPLSREMGYRSGPKRQQQEGIGGFLRLATALAALDRHDGNRTGSGADETYCRILSLPRKER